MVLRIELLLLRRPLAQPNCTERRTRAPAEAGDPLVLCKRRFRSGSILPALLVSRLKRLHDSAVEARDIHNSVIGADITLD